MGDTGKQPMKAAFEIKKGPRQVMILSETEVAPKKLGKWASPGC